MVRILVAAVLGGIVLFAWGFASWAVAPSMFDWHRMYTFPEEDTIIAAFREVDAPTGMYFVPGMWSVPGEGELTPEQWEARREAATEKHREGPVALVAYRAEGSEPMQPMTLVTGFVLNVLAALVAATLLAMSNLQSYGGRVVFVLLLGAFVAFFSNLIDWNYLNQPFRFSAQVALDSLIAALLLGLLLGAIVRPRPGDVAAMESEGF